MLWHGAAAGYGSGVGGSGSGGCGGACPGLAAAATDSGFRFGAAMSVTLLVCVWWLGEVVGFCGVGM